MQGFGGSVAGAQPMVATPVVQNNGAAQQVSVPLFRADNAAAVVVPWFAVEPVLAVRTTGV